MFILYIIAGTKPEALNWKFSWAPGVDGIELDVLLKVDHESCMHLKHKKFSYSNPV